ncbi:MAG: hypothetical protein ACN4GZ_08040 [Acidimicrobiales bacterium]
MRSVAPILAMIGLIVVACSTTSNSASGAPTTEVERVTTTSRSTSTVPTSSEERPASSFLEGLTLVSSVSTGQMIDTQRPGAILQHGVAGDGEPANPLGPTTRLFTGDDSDIVVNLVGGDESDDLNPAGSRFVFQVEGLILRETSYEKLSSATRPFSWNMMQRGLAGNPGGQWKMSLVNEAGGRVKAQCVVRDEANRLIRVNSSTEILPDQPATVSCIFDDMKNELIVDVDGRTDGASAVVNRAVDGVEVVVFDPEAGIADEGFGDSAPQGGGTCGGALPSGIGSVITVGNKPACGIALAPEDQFQGEIAVARVWRLL